ncbi:MAG: hypothetical protein JXA94_00370 [Parachlamydiales bacterium]|nr:hypothetical protein [Parachlamydiales bacterium]
MPTLGITAQNVSRWEHIATKREQTKVLDTPVKQEGEEYDEAEQQKVAKVFLAQEYNTIALRDEKYDSQMDPKKYFDPKEKIEQYRDEIADVVDKRLQLFFQQLICCWNVPFYFESISAQDQIGIGKKTTVTDPQTAQTVKYDTQAAHTSTFPALKAYEIDDLGQKIGQGFIYLKYSDGYWQHNSTIDLPIEVNKADCILDGTKTNSQLRDKSIALINKVAKNTISPQKAFEEFAKVFSRQLDSSIQKLDESDPRRDVLIIYQKRLNEILPLIEDEDFFDNLIGVKIAASEKENLLRKIVFERRFKLIQFTQNAESIIARRVLDAQNEMLKKHSKTLKAIDPRLRYTLLEAMDPIYRKKLEKLLCTSLEQLRIDNEKNEERLRTFEEKNRIAKFRQDHDKKIHELKKEVQKLIDTVFEEELKYRSFLFKDLRTKYNSLKQVDFVHEYQLKHPLAPMSSARVSRIEQRTRADTKLFYQTPITQRRVNMDVLEARNIAETFGIDAGLFLPSTIAADY